LPNSECIFIYFILFASQDLIGSGGWLLQAWLRSCPLLMIFNYFGGYAANFFSNSVGLFPFLFNKNMFLLSFKVFILLQKSEQFRYATGGSLLFHLVFAAY
jgi:hypothetical protein